MSSIEDVTRLELREVDATGTLKAGEKSLAELRKRKLIVQRYFVFISSISALHFIILFWYQERSMVHCSQGAQFQYIDCEARDRFDG